MWIMLLRELFDDHVLLSFRCPEILPSDDFSEGYLSGFVKTGNGLPEIVESVLSYPVDSML